MGIIFIFALIILITIMYIFELKFKPDEYFNSKSQENTNTNTNAFYEKIPNIFFTDKFIDNLYVGTEPQSTSLQSIQFNSYINSDIVSNKIICSNITNQGKCWDNNNCQWINKINEKSYCTIAPKLL